MPKPALERVRLIMETPRRRSSSTQTTLDRERLMGPTSLSRDQNDQDQQRFFMPTARQRVMQTLARLWDLVWRHQQPQKTNQSSSTPTNVRSDLRSIQHPNHFQLPLSSKRCSRQRLQVRREHRRRQKSRSLYAISMFARFPDPILLRKRKAPTAAQLSLRRPEPRPLACLCIGSLIA